MEQFLQAVGLAVVGAVLALVVGKHTKEMSVLLTMGCAVGIVVLALHFLEPVVDLVTELRLLGELQHEHVSILLKAAGMSDVTLRLYPDGHHEMLNELCRYKVYADLIAWIEYFELGRREEAL